MDKCFCVFWPCRKFAERSQKNPRTWWAARDPLLFAHICSLTEPLSDDMLIQSRSMAHVHCLGHIVWMFPPLVHSGCLQTHTVLFLSACAALRYSQTDAVVGRHVKDSDKWPWTPCWQWAQASIHQSTHPPPPPFIMAVRGSSQATNCGALWTTQSEYSALTGGVKASASGLLQLWALLGMMEWRVGSLWQPPKTFESTTGLVCAEDSGVPGVRGGHWRRIII